METCSNTSTTLEALKPAFKKIFKNGVKKLYKSNKDSKMQFNMMLKTFTMMLQDQDTKEVLITPTQLRSFNTGEMPFKVIKILAKKLEKT